MHYRISLQDFIRLLLHPPSIGPPSRALPLSADALAHSLLRALIAPFSLRLGTPPTSSAIFCSVVKPYVYRRTLFLAYIIIPIGTAFLLTSPFPEFVGRAYYPPDAA